MSGQAQKKWLQLKQLQNPFNDAVNYRSRQEKEFFNKIFFRTQDLIDCLKSSIYYLIGEKGSGKTAYASYLENNEIDGHRCKLSTMTETQYKRFISLKKKGKLDYSDYANIWRPMLLNMVAQAIVVKSKDLLSGFTGKFDIIEEEISTFNKDALNPEVEVAFDMIAGTSDKLAVGPVNYAQFSMTDSSTIKDTSQIIKHHLLEKEHRLKEAIADLKLKNDHILFIDGIDYRPEDVSYSDYLACVKGLGEAVWQLNLEYFGNIRDSKGRIKIVLLVRPDVFHSLNLYNSNSRLRDNSVLLDWSTTEIDLKTSQLYLASDRYFSGQQHFDTSTLECADHYFSAGSSNEIFKQFLRNSFQKPRDLLTVIRIAKDVSIKKLNRGHENKFDVDVIRNAYFTREFADYMLGEARNYAAFYMTQADFDKYLKFFQYLDGNAEFSSDSFSDAFNKFKNWANGEKFAAPAYLRDPEALLQFFYDMNIIGYREEVGDDRGTFYHFAFRERTLTNVAPKIKISAALMINRGLAKALDIGLRSHQNASSSERPNEVRRAWHSNNNGNKKSKRGKLENSNESKNTAPVAHENLSDGTTPTRRRRRKRVPKPS